MDIRRRPSQPDPEFPYATVKLTPQVIDIFATQKRQAYRPHSPIGVRPEISLQRAGDLVSITVFEAGAGGLFIPSEAGVQPKFIVNIPNQRVDYSGDLTMPYAPPIRAAGRTAPGSRNVNHRA